MGCRSDYYGEDPSVNRELDLVTRLLCEMIQNHPQGLSKEAQKWWDEHQKWDRQRKAVETEANRRAQAKREAYMKLTPDERKLLNIRNPDL